MPNWCANAVELSLKSNASDEAKRIFKLIKDNRGDKLCSIVIPIPDDQEDNWYSFCVGNWGTKWDVHDVDYDENEGTISMTFDTAWSPPMGVYVKLYNLGFNIKVGFCESGVQYVGGYDNGITYDSSWEELVGEYPQEEDFNNDDEYWNAVNQREEEIFDYFLNNDLPQPAHLGG